MESIAFARSHDSADLFRIIGGFMKKHSIYSVYRWRRICVSSVLLLSQYEMLYATEKSEYLDYSTLQGVTATATRTEREVFKVPESVSIVNQSQIEIEQETDLAAVVEHLPNIDIEGGPRSSGQRINIRGLSDQRVLYLLDGARQNLNRAHNSRVFLDPELLKKVEVVRGPTTLWGSGALAGVIALTTKDAFDLLRPGERWGAKLKGGFQGVNDQWLSNSSVYGLAGENLDYLLNFSYRNANDIRLGNGSNLQNSGFESYAGLAKFTWTPDAFNTVGFSAQTFDKDSQIPSNPQSDLGRANPLVDRDTKTRNYTWRYDFEDPDNLFFQPDIVVYYNTIETEENRTIDPRLDETFFETVGVNVRNVMQFDHSKVFAQTLSYGVDYYHDEAEGKRDGQERTSFPKAQSDVVGVYVQDEIMLWQRLTVTPGVRWDFFETQANDSSLAKQNENELSFKVGLSFEATDWLSFHAAYNEAFRAPNLNELFVTGTHFTCGPGCANLFVPNPGLNPEKAQNKEIGFRLYKDLLFVEDDKARFRFSYFHNQVDNFIDTLVDFTFEPVIGNPGLGGTTTNQNVRDARLEGFEVELNYEVPFGYTGIAYSQTRGKNKTTGEQLSDIPADKWVVTAGLRFPEWGISLGWRSSLVGKQDRIPTEGTVTQSYDIHDLNLAWTPLGKLSDLKLNFGIDNITDQNYRKHLSVLKEPGINYKTSVSWQF